MGFGDAIKSGFQNYVNFSGRASRSEFWYWFLFSFLVYIVARVGGQVIGGENAGVVLMLIVWAALILPYLAVSVRRLHDIDKSGWFYLIYIIPLVGFIFWLIWNCSQGTPGANRFGGDPVGYA